MGEPFYTDCIPAGHLKKVLRAQFPVPGEQRTGQPPPPPRTNNDELTTTIPTVWTGKGNPYTRTEVIERLHETLRKNQPIIAAGAGTGISAKFIEKGGADLIIIYNSGRFRMMGHGSTAGMMAYGDANAIAMEIGEYEVLPVVEEVPVICGVHATDPRRRMWHWLGRVKEMGFSGVNNFPTHTIIDGHFRGVCSSWAPLKRASASAWTSAGNGRSAIAILARTISSWLASRRALSSSSAQAA